MSCPICGKQSLNNSNLYCREHNKEELVKEYLNTIALRLSADYGLSFEVAVRAVEDLDLLNIYKDNYDFLLHKDISTWVDLAFDRYTTKELKYKLNTDKPIFLTPTLERAIENRKNRTIVKPQSNHLLVYQVQPTTKNTIAGDIVLYDNQIWFNTGNIVALMQNIKKESDDTNMDNYIMINGIKIELTEEQIKQISDITNTCTSKCKNENKNPFNDRSKKVNDCFYYITSDGVRLDDDDDYNAKMITVANSFNDEAFANQLCLHELLNRKLLKYAWDNEAEDCEWDNNKSHYYICLNKKNSSFGIALNTQIKEQKIYFSKREVAKQAIKDVVKPFMKEHPEFVW